MKEGGERERERERLIDNQEVTEGRYAQRPVGTHRLWALGRRRGAREGACTGSASATVTVTTVTAAQDPACITKLFASL
jgi:hypothetical protein